MRSRQELRARIARFSGYALLLLYCIACKDHATIGGLCPGDCELQPDASADACSTPDCAADGGEADQTDACSEQGCTPDAGTSCEQGSFPLERAELGLLIAVDDAASIVPWWPQLSEGLKQFLNQSGSHGIEVGLQRFGRPLPIEACDAQQFVDPIVPIAPLQDNLAALLQAIPSATPTATTSTIPVLDGALRYASSWASANPNARVAVVLATDASPGQCDALTGIYDDELARVARSARQGSPPIDTYVVGFGALQTLGTLAAAGGTSLAAISTMPSDAEVLVAFERIRGAAQPCSFALPPGMSLAPAAQVIITAASGVEQRYEVLRGSADCSDDGFYTVDDSAPYPLNACPRTCAAIAASDRLSVSSACK